MNKIIYKYELSFVLLFIIVLTSCSTTARYQILSTVFDGVPDPNAKQKELVDSKSSEKVTEELNTAPAKRKETIFIYHPPYRNRMCDGCHDMRKGNELIKQIPDLCYKCHENITDQNPSLHGPVAMGDCNVCHSPHLAKNEFLLVRKGRDLCLHCHESTYIYENKNHFAAEELGCLDCHDPHSGKDRFLLN